MASPTSEALISKPVGIPRRRAVSNSPLRGLLVPFAVLFIWEVTVRYGFVSAHLMPPPSAIIGTFRDLVQDGTLGEHVAASGLRVLLGFTFGALLGVMVGLFVGLSKQIEALLDPSFQALRAIPSLAWVPLLLLWLGIDEGPKLTLIGIGAFFPIYLGTVTGVQSVDRKLVEVGEIYGLDRYAKIRRIFLPATLPNLFTGLRNGLSLAWMFVVAAELIAATRGLGYLLTDGRETGRADIVIVAIITLALLGKLSDTVLRSVERRMLVWRDAYEACQ